MPTVTTPPPVELTSSRGKFITISGVSSLQGNKLFEFNYDGRRAYIRQSMFVGERAEARKRLDEHGIAITDNGFWSDILGGIEDVPTFVPGRVSEAYGWAPGPCFTDRNGMVYSAKGQPRVRSTLPRRKGSTKGTFKYWKAEVAQHLTGQNLPMLAVMAALAAPLLEIVGEPQNFGVEFCGPPETGKTTCLRLAASVGGDPNAIPNFNSTLAGLERLFIDHRDLPLPVDEANLIGRDDQFLKDFAFRMANGTTRLTAHASDHDRYPFVFLTTSNVPFHANLRGVDPLTASAALQRLIPLVVPGDNPLGVFDFLPPRFASSGAMASHINDAITRSHGRAMSRFLKALVNERAKDPAAFKNALLRDVQALEHAVGIADTQRGKTRVSSAFGLLNAAGQFAKAKGILPRAWDCLAACVAGYRNYLAQLPRQTPVEARLLAIAQRPQTMDLRDRPLPDLTDEEVEQHGAFIKPGVGGRAELLLKDRVRKEFFPDFNVLKQAFKRDGRIIYEPGHDQAHRQIRTGKKRERWFCFVLPASVVELLE